MNKMISLSMLVSGLNRIFKMGDSSFKRAYVTFCLVIAFFCCVRLCWSWPNALWQSEFWIFPDIHNLVNHHFAQVTWFEAGTRDWSLNAWRWFSYLNAFFFGWNTYLELIAYYVIVVILSIAIGCKILNSLNQKLRITIFLVPLILLSLVSAGARGMELGTYAGVLLTVFLFFDLTKPKITLTKVLLLPFFLVFGTSGGYAIPVLFALFCLFFVLKSGSQGSGLYSEVLRRISHYSISSLIWLSLYAALFAHNGGLKNPGGGLSVLLRNDPLYFIKFLFFSQSATLISNQTLESNSQVKLILYGVSIFVLLLSICSLINLQRNNLLKFVVPLALFLYSLGVSLLIMVTRPTGPTGMLATWYGLHLKLGLIGVFWISIVSASESQLQDKVNFFGFGKTTITVISSIVIISVLGISNLKQFRREPSERNYFINVQKALLNPSSLSADASGLTPLLLPLEQSKIVIGQLSSDKLNVYARNTVIPNGISFSPQLYYQAGEAYSDGWLGKTSTLSIASGTCVNLELAFAAYQAVLPQDLYIYVSNRPPIYHRFVHPEYNLVIENLKPGDMLTLKLSKELVPANIGQGPDLRALSSHLMATCFQKR